MRKEDDEFGSVSRFLHSDLKLKGWSLGLGLEMWDIHVKDGY